MQPDNFGYQQPTVARSGANIDAGLRAHMQRVYNRMAGGLLTTGVVAWLIVNTGAINFFMSNMIMTQIIMMSPIAIIFFGCGKSKEQKDKFPKNWRGGRYKGE